MYVVPIVTFLLGVAAADTGSALPQDRVPHPKFYVHLSDISRSNKGATANLYDRQNAYTIPVSIDHTFQIRDIDGGVRLQGKPVHIGARDVVFESDGKTFAVHLGETLQSALERPLTDDEVNAAKKDSPALPDVKRFALEFRNKPWNAVFEWLSDQTGMRNVSNVLPPGTFTLISPTNKTYSLPEVVDIINEALAPQGYILIRRDQSFTVVPVSDPIDPASLPRVKADELGQRGPNELVSVLAPLGRLDGAEVAADVRRLIGPFGNLTLLARSNELLLQDTAGNLKKVVDTIKELEAKQPAETPEKSWTVEMRDRPWPEVFGWLTELTGLPVVGQARPTGTFTFVGQPNRNYPLAEIVDMLNDALMVQKLMLIRRGHSFALVPSDEPVDPALVPRVKLSELSSRGNSELVSVLLPVTNLTADDVAIEAERMLGPQGRVTPLAKANQVIVQDTAGNIRRIIDTTRTMEERTPRRR